MPSARDETERRNARDILPLDYGGLGSYLLRPLPRSLPAGSIAMMPMAALFGLDFAQVTCSVEEPGD
jgi:hypothetical protein